MYNPHNFNPTERYSLSETMNDLLQCECEIEAYLQRYGQPAEPDVPENFCDSEPSPEEINKETEEKFFGI